MTLTRVVSFAAVAVCALLLFPVAGQAHKLRLGTLVISHPWMRQSPKSAGMAAGFFSITNNGKEDDALVEVAAEVTRNVQMHDMKKLNDVVTMLALPRGIAIPAGATVDLKPGSLHVLFLDLKKPLMVGEEVKATLLFEKAGTLELEFEVLEPDAGLN